MPFARVVTLALLILFPIFIYIVHCVLSRLVLALRPNSPPLPVAIIAMALGFAVVLGSIWLIDPMQKENAYRTVFGLLYVVIVCGCLAQSYFHLFAMGETARRLHIAYELKIHGPMTTAELAQRYGEEKMLTARLERLISADQICLQADRYVLKKRFLYCVANILMKWSHCLGFHSKVLEAGAPQR